MSDVLGLPNSPYIVTYCNGKLIGFLLFENIEKLNVVLQKYGCRAIQENELGWGFDTSLPQEVRDAMREHSFYYALTSNNNAGMVYFYKSGYTTKARLIKYLKLFAQENVKIKIDGKIFSYFMTNDDKALSDKLWKYNCLFPSPKDWKVNYALHKNVLDKMSELGAKYSITFSHGSDVLNWYDGRTPYIIHLKLLSKIHHRKIITGYLNKIIKEDDDKALEKFFTSQTNPDKELILSCTPLMLASSYNSKKVIKKLLSIGASVNAANKEGVTPLMVAAAQSSKETIQILLDAGADKNLRAKSGWTASIFALVNNREDIANFLSKDNTVTSPLNEKLSFHDRLGSYVARFISTGEHKASEIYKNLSNNYMTRKAFSKLQSHTTHPTKRNVILLSIGLKLSLEDAETLLLSAGYAFSKTDEQDKIIKEFLKNKNHDIFKIDSELYQKTGKSLMNQKREK